MKLIVKRGVVALVIAGVIPALSIPANAFSGGVTTVYTSPTATTVSRARTFTATTPELNQTYQRTMRTAQTAAAVATASRGVIRGLLGTAMTIGTLAILASDVYGIWTKKADGTNELMGKPLNCDATSCYEYSVSEFEFRGPTAMSACVDFARVVNTRGGNYFFEAVRTDDRFCYYKYTDKNAPYSVTTSEKYILKFAIPLNNTLQPYADADVESVLLKNDRLLPILKTLDDLDKSISFPAPEVEDMPQPIPINPVTVTRPDGSKTITQTTLEPYRATNNDVQWRKNETVTEVSKPAADGTTTSTTGTTATETGKSSVPEKPSEAPATDTPLPGPPKLYTRKYPDGLTGVWAAQRALMVATPLFTLAKGLMPSVAMSGSCPTMPINLTFSNWANFGTKDVAPPCEVWDWGKAITIVSALLLARSLIFGG